jgi:thiol-disulfide isomerase/thioredoxin
VKPFWLQLCALVFTALRVSLWAQPLNDSLWQATPVTGSQLVINSSNVNATSDPGEPVHGEGKGLSVWWVWTAPLAGGLDLSTEGSGFDTILAIYSGNDYSDLALRAINDDERTDTASSRLILNVKAGETFFIVVDSFDGETGLIRLFLNLGPTFPPPLNDNFANAAAIVGLPATAAGENAWATREPDEKLMFANAGGASVWWVWTSPVTAKVLVSTAGSSFDTMLGVYSGSSLAGLTLIGLNDDSQGPTSAVRFNAQQGTTYYFCIDGYKQERGDIKVNLSDLSPKAAPAWEMIDLNGELISHASLTGKVYLLNFWATWCGPCTVEIPDLISLYEQYKEQGLVVVGPSLDHDGESVVRQFVNSYKITYPVGMANDQMVNAYDGDSSIPATFVVDRNGLLQQTFLGSQSRSTFEKAILPLLLPKLSCHIAGEELVLKWPAAISGYIVSHSLDLNDWIPETSSALLEDGSWTIHLPHSEAKVFYRLQR